MQKLYLKHQPVMTYKQWVIEHAKRSLRSRSKKASHKLRKGFVRVWNGTIDNLQAFLSLSKKDKLYCIGVIAGVTAFAGGLIAVLNACGESDLFAIGIRNEYGTYTNGYVTVEDEVYPVKDSLTVGLSNGEIATITFATNGTEETSDDVVTDVQGWNLFN